MRLLKSLVLLRRSNIYYRNYSSVNNEVEKFSKIGKDWWDKDSSKGTGPLHSMNPTRVGFIRRCIAWELGRKDYPALDQIRGVRILDVGCGGGLLSEALARLGANVTAIDPSKRNIEIASEHSSLDPLTAAINYKNISIEEMASSGEKFDAVCSLEVIEHVNEPLNFISNCSACLDNSKETAPSLILSTINRNTKSYAMAILGAEYIIGMVPVGTHDWNKFIKPDELTRLVESSLSRLPNEQNTSKGTMKVKKIQGLRFNGIPGKYMSWNLDDTDIDVNYILHAVMTK